MQYWIGRNGQKLGPYTIEDLRGMAANGGAVASDLVWADGMPNWAPLFSVIPAPPPAAAPPPPPPPPQMAAPPPPAWQQPQQPQQQQPQPAPSYQYSQQQQAPQSYQQPQAAQPYQMAAPMAMPVNTGVMPPEMHWALVFVIGMFTSGLFSLFWLFREAGFVKKIDPASKATSLILIGIVAEVAYIVVSISSLAFDSLAMKGIMALIGLVLALAALACFLMGIFQMRTSLQNYYNSVEPIGLRLSAVMTFFFSIFYFQYHFSRITKWKTTGVLDPQG